MAVESRAGPTEFLGLGRSRFLWTLDRKELNGVSRPRTQSMCHEREARQHRCSASSRADRISSTPVTERRAAW